MSQGPSNQLPSGYATPLGCDTRLREDRKGPPQPQRRVREGGRICSSWLPVLLRTHDPSLRFHGVHRKKAATPPWTTKPEKGSACGASARTRSPAAPPVRATPSAPRAATPPPSPPRHRVAKPIQPRPAHKYSPRHFSFPRLVTSHPTTPGGPTHHPKTSRNPVPFRRLCLLITYATPPGRSVSFSSVADAAACAIRGCRRCRRAARRGRGCGRRECLRRPPRRRGRARPSRTTTACARPRRTGGRSGAGGTASATSGGAGGSSRGRAPAPLRVPEPGRRCMRGWRLRDAVTVSVGRPCYKLCMWQLISLSASHGAFLCSSAL
ncbi:hypothetical protein PVAP13_5NG528786 [Panicum virgatum]|uniref:Uncharacterized protein n=1 Tax=Panicum virgatum TaxID=38727 RepID=A0A8T0S5U5_PANVG|nr:hypothetical protein PVAP13_5NG528786 [Panicum virgatum]